MAENLVRLRTDLGWTQADIAEAMARRAGWSASTVAWVESGRRALKASELAWLCEVLGVPASEFLAGTGYVLFSDDSASMHLRILRDNVTGTAPFGARPKMRRTESEAAAREDDRKAAARLGVTPERFRILVAQRYGRPFVVERDRRVGDVEGLAPRSLQAKRGHATRQIIDELREGS